MTVRIQATCTLQIPAEQVEEAIQSAYNSPILSERLYDIDKDVVKIVRMEETKKKVTVSGVPTPTSPLESHHNH